MGELWGRDDCSGRVAPATRAHQPHYQLIDAEDQVQIYQELTSTPPAQGPTECGHDAPANGELTTSFLSTCAEVKDNRILPHGYLDLAARREIAVAPGRRRRLGRGRLRLLTAYLDLDSTKARDWKLELVSTGDVPLTAGD